MSKLEIVKHPGELLYEQITATGMKQKELALRTGMSEKHISTVINGTKDISASFARRLDIALGAENGTWARYQSEYDQYVLKLEEEHGITDDEISILKSMKDIVDFFLKENILHNHCGNSEKVMQLRQVLRVNNLSVIPQITYNAAYRAQVKTSTNINPYILFAWQRMCEIFTEGQTVHGVFDRQKLENKALEIRKLAFEDDPNMMIKRLSALFAECGVAFAVVHHFRGAPVQGFIKQTDGGRIILCLTFHEIAHLINGDLNVRFVDFESVKSAIEDRADLFARDALIDPSLYKEFVASGKYHSLAEIKAFSKLAGIPHWITIGRLHSDEWLDWSHFANEAPSYEWVSSSS